MARAEARLKEAERLGFGRAAMPAGNLGDATGGRGTAAVGRSDGLTLFEIEQLSDLVARIAAGSADGGRPVPIAAAAPRAAVGGSGRGGGRDDDRRHG